MFKLDKSSGLSPNQIGIIKFKIKNAVKLKLPEMPEHIQMQLFMDGRDAWTYSWKLININVQSLQNLITVEVDLKLKKEFLQYQHRTRYTFSCQVILQPDMYATKVSIREKRSELAVPIGAVK